MSAVRPTPQEEGASPSSRVTEAIPCAECEYNLIGQPEAGRCPECSYPVDESIRAGGFWTFARVRSLRWATLAFAASVPVWIISTAISRVTSPTQLLRTTVAAFLVIHIVAALASGYLGLRASSRLAASARRLLLAGAAIILIAAGGIPILVIADAITRSSQSVMWFLGFAIVARLCLTMLCLWWIAAGLASLRPLWTGSLLSLRIALAVLAAGWGLFGVSIAAARFTSRYSGLRIEGIANVTFAADWLALLLGASIGIALCISLGRAPRRVSYASEPS
jgi:hypothetical protein